MKTLLIIDANSLIHRCFHSLPPLSAPDGRATNALYGLSNILLKLNTQEHPDYMVACFDRPEPTFRKQEHQDYKAHRPKAAPELISQIIEAHDVFKIFGVAVVERPGFEADDMIASVVEQFRHTSDLRLVVLTGDLDTLQLVQGDHIVVRTFRTGITDTFTYNEAAVKERFTLNPSQMRDYKALVGDPSDNIKGVPGVGAKTAAAILQRFGTLERALKDKASEPKLMAKVVGHEGDIQKALSLVTLARHALAHPLELSDLATTALAVPALRDYFSARGFTSLLKRLDANVPPSSPPTSVPEESLEADIDAELFSDGWTKKQITSPRLKVGFYLKEIAKDAIVQKLELHPPLFDLGVAAWLVDPDAASYDPEDVFGRFLKKEWTGTAGAIGTFFKFISGKIDEYHLRKIFEYIEMPLIPVLAVMETTGIAVSISALQKIEEEINERITSLREQIVQYAGHQFNINSPSQLAQVLFGDLGIVAPAVKTATGKRSTKADYLESIRDRHPIVSRIIEYREHYKIQSTYVRPLQGLVGEDGRLHTDYIQTGTGTGRLSSQSPNLQNIPQESVWAKALRDAFIAPAGWRFVAFDYSQLELRLLATLSDDENMKRAFFRGADIHRETAAYVFGISARDVTPGQRRIAKTLNFGLVYGMGVNAFAKASNLKRKEAQEFIDSYFRTFSRVKLWQRDVISQVSATGYAQTLTGRRRYFFDIASSSRGLAAAAARAAINFPVQGLEADIIKMAMIAVEREIRQRGWEKSVHMLLSIHDELLLEVASDMIPEVAPVIAGLLEGIYPSVSVPLVVAVKEGERWGSMQPRS